MENILTKALVASILLLSAIFSAAYGQKLPTEQTISLRSPANIKVDGKATEWDNKFQAYNNHVDFFYILSNDNENLYLIIQAKQPDIIRRILRGSITFTINKSGKKNDNNGIQITYPLVAGLSVPLKNSTIRYTGTPPITEGDSVMNVANKRLDEKSKEIKVTGIKGVDSLISVYNTDGIKAVSAFDTKMGYTYELAVSLKNLGMSAQASSKFAYQLRINEVEQRGIVMKTTDGQAASTFIDVSQLASISIGKNAQIGQAATDLGHLHAGKVI